VDGIGAPLVFQEMWPLLNRLIDDSLVVGLEAVASAIRLLAERNHVIAEGAGAAGIAAAIAGMAGGGKVVCVISGGNIDPTKLIRILQGEVP
jgi:threonine dehydratase